MGRLFGRRVLPATTYGYQPPPEATAHGWQCNNKDCGTGDSPAPRTWPAACPICGRPVDPDFNEPWREESRGLRLQMFADRETTEIDPYVGGVREWKYGRALARGDLVAAEGIRKEFHRWMARRATEWDGFQPAPYRSAFVHHAVEYGQTDAAAQELTDWFATSNVYRRDFSRLGASDSVGNSLRVDSFNLVRCALMFLDSPGAARHPLSAAIDRDVRYLGGATQHEMALDLRYQWQTRMRTPELGR